MVFYQDWLQFSHRQMQSSLFRAIQELLDQSRKDCKYQN